MCGIVGIAFANKDPKPFIKKMTKTLTHRGPDQEGCWVEVDVALGHRRLSILDVSNSGIQPMHSNSDRYVLVFNGEIYNYRELRLSLNKKYKFKSKTDTEVLLAAIETWGIRSAIEKIDGMFAFALWDRKTKELYLARDPFGEKPLYYGWHDKTLLFGSELKALMAYNVAEFRVDQVALAKYLRYGYVPSPSSIYKDVYKLEPGHYLHIKSANKVQKVQYWDANARANHGYYHLLNTTLDKTAEELEEKLESIVESRLVSDVPIGTFLSGGIDSSLITAIAQKVLSKPVKTFTIGFHDKNFNEATYAKAVAEHLKTNHVEYYVDEKEALEVVPKLSSIYDEPFADSSQIPTYLVSKYARKHVTVCLSGDGGDELFGGYNRYIFAEKLWDKLKYIPNPLASAISFMSHLVANSIENIPTLENYLTESFARTRKIPNIFHKIKTAGEVFKHTGGKYMLYQFLVSQIKDPNQFLAEKIDNAQTFQNFKHIKLPLTEFKAWMMLVDTLSYMQDDILTKVDRASMAVSLETRAPFLSKDLFEYAWQIPLNQKIKGNDGKIVLKTLLEKHIPKELIDRPKMGFGVPLSNWLRGGLKDWANDLLVSENIKDYFDTKIVDKYWQQHLSKKREWGYALWNILMFQAWRQEHEKNSLIS